MEANKDRSEVMAQLVEVNRTQAEHRATWMALLYDEMVKRGADADAITKKAIRETGHIHGEKYKGMLKDPKDCAEFADAFLSDVARATFDQDIEADYDNLKMVFHYCPLLSAWKKLGLSPERIEKLCDLAMEGDRGIMEVMGLDFDLQKTLANGDNCCLLCLTKKEEG